MHFHEISISRTRVLKIFILLSVEKTIVTSTNLHREKMILNKKVNWLHMVFLYESQFATRTFCKLDMRIYGLSTA